MYFSYEKNCFHLNKGSKTKITTMLLEYSRIIMKFLTAEHNLFKTALIVDLIDNRMTCHEVSNIPTLVAYFRLIAFLFTNY